MKEEISLREIIEMILKGKWIISSVTAMAILLTWIYSFFIVTPTYQATALVRFAGNMENQEMALNSFSETTRSEVVVQRIIDRLKLEEQGYTASKVSKAIHVQSIKGTSVIAITVKDHIPEMATLIANTLALDLGTRTIISGLATKIVDVKERLLDLGNREKIINSEIRQLEELLAVTPEKLVTSKVLAEETYLLGVVSDLTNQGNLPAGALELRNEEINPVHVQLRSRLAEKKLELTNIQSDILNMQSLLEENENKIDQLESQFYDEEKLNFNQIQRLLEGDFAVFVTPSLQPSEPVAPNKAFNVLIGAILGCLASVFIVFLRYYWNVTKPKDSLIE